MSFTGWIALTGVLLLAMALSPGFLRGLPITASLVYVCVGLVLGPMGLGWIAVDFMKHSIVFEHLTEVAVIISLFVCGLKLRLPLSHPAWAASFRLAGPVMLASIAGVGCLGHFGLGMGWPEAFLLGAVLAPTDPVLASAVAVNDAADEDRLRYGLSGEAGLNDGAAFPFVIFALMWMNQGPPSEWFGEWAMHRLVWGVPAGLLLGFFLGRWVGHFAIRLRCRNPDSNAPNDFLALSLIALSYAGAEALGAWGFLAVFAAGLGFRKTEIRLTETHPHDSEEGSEEASQLVCIPSPATENHPPAEYAIGRAEQDEELRHPTKAVGHIVADIITFGDTAERLLEVMLVILLGICLPAIWDWRAIPLALGLFVIIRPVSTLLLLTGTRTRPSQRALMGWFGIRGIGSLYYLSYALNHGVDEGAEEIVALTLSTVALSVLVHGLTSPLLDYYEKKPNPDKIG